MGKQESEAQSAIYNTLKKSEETRLNLIKEYRDRRLNTVNAGEKNLLLEQSKLNDSGELTEKDYKNRLLAIEITSLYSRLEIAKDYKNDAAELEFQNGEVKAKALKEAGIIYSTLNNKLVISVLRSFGTVLIKFKISVASSIR